MKLFTFALQDIKYQHSTAMLISQLERTTVGIKEKTSNNSFITVNVTVSTIPITRYFVWTIKVSSQGNAE